jgi:hypothetical protein
MWPAARSGPLDPDETLLYDGTRVTPGSGLQRALMASIFIKADPRDESVQRWMGKVEVGDEWVALPLRLLAPGSRREAATRADDLRAEIRAGLLSETTRTRLGDRTFARLTTAIGRSSMQAEAGRATTGQSVCAADIAPVSAKDTRTKHPREATVTEHGERRRISVLRRFVARLAETGDSKTGKGRRVPVVPEWVRRALVEARARPGVTVDSPACPNVVGGPFVRDGSSGDLLAKIIGVPKAPRHGEISG